MSKVIWHTWCCPSSSCYK